MEKTAIDDRALCAQFQSRLSSRGYVSRNEISLTKVAHGAAEGVLHVTPDCLNPMGIVHGGALSGLMDTIAGCAVATLSYHSLATNSSTISYLRAASDGTVHCSAQVKKAGKRICVVTVSAFDHRGQELAIGTFQFSVLSSE